MTVIRKCDKCRKEIVPKVIGVHRFVVVEFDEYDRELNFKDICGSCMIDIDWKQKKKNK